MASLLGLPIEILNYTIESMDPYDKHALFQLSLTCKLLNKLATPIMYRTVALYKPKTAGCQQVPILAFIRSVLSSPARASMVTSFAVSSLACSKAPEAVNFNTFISHLRETIPDKSRLELWEKRLFNYKELLDDDLLPGCIAFLAALCLPRLSRILFSDHFSNSQWDLLRDILEGNANRGEESLICGVWPMLDSVTLHGMRYVYYERDYTAPLAVFALLPGVKRLHASWQADPDLAGQPSCLALLPPHSTALEELILQPMCLPHPFSLEILLRVPKNLRVFKFHVRGLADEDTPFESKWLERLLRHQSHSLEHISLTHKWYEEDLRLDREVEIEPMSFSNFVALKTIEISPAFVFGSEVLQLERVGFRRSVGVRVPDPSPFGIESTKSYIVEMLPRSIESLRFAQCYEFWDAQRLDRALVELIRYRDERFPNLNTIEVHIVHFLKETWKFELPWATVEARLKGVSLRFFKGGRLGLEHIGGEDLGKSYLQKYEGNERVYQVKKLDDSDFQEREAKDDGDDKESEHRFWGYPHTRHPLLIHLTPSL